MNILLEDLGDADTQAGDESYQQEYEWNYVFLDTLAGEAILGTCCVATRTFCQAFIPIQEGFARLWIAVCALISCTHTFLAGSLALCTAQAVFARQHRYRALLCADPLMQQQTLGAALALGRTGTRRTALRAAQAGGTLSICELAVWALVKAFAGDHVQEVQAI